MKKILLIVVSLVFAFNSLSAQEGEVTISVHGAYGVDELESFGFGARMSYGFADAFRVAPAFTHYLENKNISANVIDMNVHYVIKGRRMMSFYPLVGPSIVLKNVSNVPITDPEVPDWDPNVYEADKRSSTSVGLNLGLGLEYEFNQQFRAFVEVHRTVGSDIPQFVGTVGLAFVFF